MPNAIFSLHVFCCLIQVMADPPFIVAEVPSKCFWPQPYSVQFDVPSIIRYREIFRQDAMSTYQSPWFRIWMRYLAVSWLVISHDMGYDITIYRDVSCDITPDHLKSPGENNFNENRPPCRCLRFDLGPCLCPPLALSPTWPFLSSFSCPSGGHIIGLTVPLANINLVPSWFGLLPECMIVFVPYLRFLSFPVSFTFLLYIEWYPYRYISKIFLGSDIDTYRIYINIEWYTRSEKPW